jgi:HSP20 family protein
MLSLTRNLFDDLFSVPRELDNLFERTWPVFGRTQLTLPGRTAGFYPQVESYTKDGNFVYRLAIPGVDPKNVDLSIAGGQLVVKGERAVPSELKDEDWFVQEFRYGQFERIFNLPDGVDIDQVTATFHNGILEITVPAGKAQLPRKIEIKQIRDSERRGQLKASA